MRQKDNILFFQQKQAGFKYEYSWVVNLCSCVSYLPCNTFLYRERRRIIKLGMGNERELIGR